MKSPRSSSLRRTAAIAIATSLIALAGPVLSQPDTDHRANATARQAHMREHLEARLDKMAERLHINDAQQGAWKSYTQTLEGMIGTNLARPAPDADAASIARYRAQLAAERAQKLAQLADATTELQQVLTPEQQQTLNEMTRRMGRGNHGKHGGHGRRG